MTTTGPVQVFETLVRHGSDLLRWRDATSAADPDAAAGMALLARPLVVTFDDPPPDLVWLHKPGRTALWRRPTQDIVPGLASAAERARPAVDPARDLFDLRGVVADPGGAFQPRRFALRAGGGAGHDLLLYPSPQGTRFGSGGGLVGSLRFDLLPAPDPGPDQGPSPDPFLSNPRRPVAWALIEVAVTVGVGDIRRFRAQTNANGDFRLSLWRLPPLPDGTADYAAVLTVQAALGALPASPLDPAGLTAMALAAVPSPDPDPAVAPPADPAPIAADAFADSLALAVVPGQVQRIPDAAPRLLALRPAA